jgi:hypothetical protein
MNFTICVTEFVMFMQNVCKYWRTPLSAAVVVWGKWTGITDNNSAVQLKVQIKSRGSGLFSYWRGNSNTGKSLTLSASNNKTVHDGINPPYIVVYLLKTRTVEPQKLPLLDNARTQQ